jgi:hypothetical protein
LESDHHNPEKENQQEETPTQRERERERETLQAQPSEEQARRYIVRLVGTNSLKEGAV